VGEHRTVPGAPEQYCPTCERSFAEAGLCPYDQTPLIALEKKDYVIGKVLDGRYTVIERLGEGGMGAVYRATQEQLGREVAIKVVSPRLVAEPEAIKRFLREAKLASRLSHPNAVSVLDFGQSGDLFFLVMELLHGQTLDVVLKEHGSLPIDRAVGIANQICDALDGAHGLGIIHRDLKPANIMLVAGAGGRDLVKVLDFGLAKTIGTDATAVTQSGAMLGTPAYMPPELALGKDADGRADLYSLGCLLYVMLSGRLPFGTQTLHELIAKHAYEDPEPLTGFPPGLTAVTMRLLAKDPNDRYQSAAATLRALAEAWNDNLVEGVIQSSGSGRTRTRTPVSLQRLSLQTPVPRAHAASMPTDVLRTQRPRRWPLVAAAIAVVALVAGGGIYLWQRQADVDDRAPVMTITGQGADTISEALLIDAAPPGFDAAPALPPPVVELGPSKPSAGTSPKPERPKRGKKPPKKPAKRTQKSGEKPKPEGTRPPPPDKPPF
jgi:serine/threonine-protein kinase